MTRKTRERRSLSNMARLLIEEALRARGIDLSKDDTPHESAD